MFQTTWCQKGRADQRDHKQFLCKKDRGWLIWHKNKGGFVDLSWCCMQCSGPCWRKKPHVLNNMSQIDQISTLYSNAYECFVAWIKDVYELWNGRLTRNCYTKQSCKVSSPIGGREIVGFATRMRASFQHKPKWSNRHDNKRGVPIEGATSNLFLGVKLIVDSWIDIQQMWFHQHAPFSLISNVLLWYVMKKITFLTLQRNIG